MRPRIARIVPKVPEREEERARRDDDHRKMVARLPCLVCGRWPPPGYRNGPHHLKRGLDPRERGKGRRASDRFSVPLCDDDHLFGVETVGDDEAWFAERDIDGRGIAAALWRERGDEEAMRRVVERDLLRRGVLVHG